MVLLLGHEVGQVGSEEERSVIGREREQYISMK